MRRSVRVLLMVAVAYAPESLAQSADRQAATAMEKASSNLTTSYLQTWSRAQAASPAYVARIYAPRIHFYGRMLDRKALVNEKQRFVRRWPVREYALPLLGRSAHRRARERTRPFQQQPGEKRSSTARRTRLAQSQLGLARIVNRRGRIAQCGAGGALWIASLRLISTASRVGQ
jgi:hypothetical protein